MYMMYEVMQIFSTTEIGADVKETLRGLSREYKRVQNITGDHTTSSDLGTRLEISPGCILWYMEECSV